MSLNSNTELALINTTNNSGSITLPIASSIPGRVITFKDNVGNFTNNNFTLICAGSDTFEDGTTSKVFNESFGFIQIVASGTKWYILCGVKQNTMTQSTLYVSTISTFSIQFSDGSFQTVSADKNINSSIIGLGTFGYISSSQLTSTVTDLVDHLELNSTIIGLGNIGYLSSFNSISSLNISSGNLFANNFTTRSISTNLISSASNYTSVQLAISYNGATVGGNINMNGSVFPTSDGGLNRDLGSITNKWNNFFVSTISSIHTTTSTLQVQNTITASSINVNNIIGFNLLGTTILSTQQIFCSSIQIGPQDAILDVVGPIRAQDMSTVTLQASTITAGTMTLDRLFGGPILGATTTQNLYPFSAGAQVGFGSNSAQLGFYNEGHFHSTFTRVIQPTLDAGAFSNIVYINGNISTPNMFISTMTGNTITASTIFVSTLSSQITFTTNLNGPNGINCQNLYPTGINILGFGTGGPGSGPWDSASIRQTLTSSIITNNISSGTIFVSSIFTNNINVSSIRVFGTLSTANMVVSSIVSGNFTLATGALVQKVVTSAVAPSGTVSLDLTQGNVFSFTTAMASSAAANFTTLNAVIGSTYYVNFLTGATPGNITFTGNTGATTLSATGSSLIGNPSVYIGLYGAAQSFTPAATTRYMFNCIVIAA